MVRERVRLGAIERLVRLKVTIDLDKAFLDPHDGRVYDRRLARGRDWLDDGRRDAVRLGGDGRRRRGRAEEVLIWDEGLVGVVGHDSEPAHIGLSSARVPGARRGATRLGKR